MKNNLMECLHIYIFFMFHSVRSSSDNDLEILLGNIDS